MLQPLHSAVIDLSSRSHAARVHVDWRARRLRTIFCNRSYNLEAHRTRTLKNWYVLVPLPPEAGALNGGNGNGLPPEALEAGALNGGNRDSAEAAPALPQSPMIATKGALLQSPTIARLAANAPA